MALVLCNLIVQYICVHDCVRGDFCICMMELIVSALFLFAVPGDHW